MFVYYLVYLCCSYLIMTTGGSVTVCMFVVGHELALSKRTHTHTYRHACGWLVCFVLAVLLRGAGTLLFDLKSIIVHLNNLACVWTNCVGMICRNWILLNMHFCVHLKTAELKKKTVMSNLFIVVSVLLENPVFRCTLYIQCCTLQRYTLFWYNIVQ